MANVKMVCIDNSGIGYLADDSTVRMSQLLTVDRVYVGNVVDGQFTTTDDNGDTAVFDVERFESVGVR